MSKGKSKKKNPHSSGAPKPLVRLSQCMIVKNEEKNIEKALGWAKGIAFEQIVVDTGSTDRTVELAEKLGARVYHFEWIGDFAAAKNYAIEQAAGNWIAFLDADEYFSPEDAKKMMQGLKQIMENPELRKTHLALNCPWIQIDDEGKPFAVFEQERLFRNLSGIRYKGRIHETLTMSADNIAHTNDISIFHTGYSGKAYESTGKAERNIELLRQEIIDRPEDLDLKGYLADALEIAGTEESREESDRLYMEVLNSKDTVNPYHKKNSYKQYIKKLMDSPDKLLERLEICKKAVREFPEDIDFEYVLAKALNDNGAYRDAWESLLSCEKKLSSASGFYDSAVISVNPMLLFNQMAIAARGLGDNANLIKYLTLILRTDRFQADILKPYICTFKQNDITDEDITGLLEKLFDFNSIKDKLFVIRAATDCGAVGLAQIIMSRVTEEERVWMSGGESEK